MAAILNSFSRAIIFAPDQWEAVLRLSRGDRARGVSAERFETPLAGGAAAGAVPAVLAGAERAAAWGEPSPPRLSLGGNGKGGSNSLLPQAILSRK